MQVPSLGQEDPLEKEMATHSSMSGLENPMDCRFLCPWGFSRQEYWSGLPFPSPGDLLDPGMEPASPVFPALQADSLLIEPPGKLVFYLRY